MRIRSDFLLTLRVFMVEIHHEATKRTKAFAKKSTHMIRGGA